ncbi:MAG TPA: GGDEF domain-containing protein [Candidatus Krumholzibacteriaceae bacterium]|nr:GGDEF domain-containing protein [Candidatus Krumholzibacteriaceae bacterium]
MKLEEDSYKKIIENLHDGLYFVDPNRVITYWNKAAAQISGFTADEVLGTFCSDNILTHIDSEGNNLCTGMCPLAATMDDGKPRVAEVYMHHKKGHRIPVSIRVSTLTDKDGHIIGGIELFTDISNQAVNEQLVKELKKLSFLDNLTQLANRRYIEKEIKIKLEEKKRYNTDFAILFMDIDHFKKINDTYGHDAGDEVLISSANTFTANSRSFDLYGRWGGEEFIGIIRNVDENQLTNIGNRVRTLIANSYISYNDRILQITISVGATLAKEDDTMESLIKRADKLMYKGKTAGRNCTITG